MNVHFSSVFTRVLFPPRLFPSSPPLASSSALASSIISPVTVALMASWGAEHLPRRKWRGGIGSSLALLTSFPSPSARDRVEVPEGNFSRSIAFCKQKQLWPELIFNGDEVGFRLVGGLGGRVERKCGVGACEREGLMPWADAFASSSCGSDNNSSR